MDTCASRCSVVVAVDLSLSVTKRRQDGVILRLERKQWWWWLIGRVFRSDLLSEEMIVERGGCDERVTTLVFLADTLLERSLDFIGFFNTTERDEYGLP